MDLQREHSPAPDYLAPDIAEVARQRGGREHDPNSRPAAEPRKTVTHSVARVLIPACFAIPAAIWVALFIGHGRGWFELDTALILFVFSVAIAFGSIVCFNLKRLSRMEQERMDAEAQFKLAKEAAEAANRFKSAFFANISHEIRTPLTAINGFAELLLNPSRTTDQRLADARVIRRNGEHLLALINDILDLSKIEAGKMSVDPILCSPATIIGEIASMLRHRASEKGLQLSIEFDGAMPRMIRTDPTRLRQILINLVSNSIKFTKEGSVSLSVSITPSFRAPSPMLQVKITDTGIGIPPERLPELFQAFVQADASITRQFGGSGLGLAISRHFARALGGDITVTSEPGTGSVFIITVGTGALADAELHPNPTEEMDLKDAFTGPRVRIKGSILVAEDGIDNQALIAERLRETGLKVELASNGQIACDLALAALGKDQPFDMILMDVQMPVMDGFTATHHLRGKGYKGPIIALTANAMERDRNKCLNAGCNDFVTKPINLESLFKAIGRYMAVEQVAEESITLEDVLDSADSDPVEQFYDALSEEVDDMNEAIDREDRVRLRELLQLIHGKASTADLKEVAAEAARLLQFVATETSWKVIRQAVRDFANQTQAQED